MESRSYNGVIYAPLQLKKIQKNSKKYHEELKSFLTNFKVHKCNDQSNHHIEYCFYYHDENDQRRNPYIGHQLLYNNYNLCKCGESSCPDFFNDFEYAYHPLSYRISLCPEQANCKGGFYCTMLHPEDLAYFQYGEFFRFDLHTFKTVKCLNKQPHERKTCLYYHNDKDKRRPSNIQHNHFICTKQKCNNEHCEFSHNKLEQLYHPDRYKTKFCQFYPNNIDNCDYKSFCSFAHTQNQIIEDIELLHLLQKNNDFYMYKYKTIWCPFTQNHQRDKCSYAHNIQDFRRNPLQYSYEPVKCENWNFSDQIKSIDGAGCEMEFNCNKCHGWMEQRYHPSKYNTKLSKSLKKENLEVPDIKKLIDLNRMADFKPKGKGNTNPQILKSNYSKGTPFFKNDKCSEYSAKTKARSNHIQSDKSIDGSSSKEVQKANDHNAMPSFFKLGLGLQSFDGDNYVNWHDKNDKHEHKKQDNSARSKSAQKSQEYMATYSNSIKSILNDEPQILNKLRRYKYNEIQLSNMDKNKIEKLSFLSVKEKNNLAMKLQIYNMKQINSVSYSKELMKYFIAKKKQGILEKMQHKRVKQAKLLKLPPKQINQLSFLQPEEKILLPKLLTEFSNQKQFEELNKRIEEETKMK